MSFDGTISRDDSPEVRDLTKSILQNVSEEGGESLTVDQIHDRYCGYAEPRPLVADLVDALVEHDQSPMERTDDQAGVYVERADRIEPYCSRLEAHQTDPFERTADN